MRFQNTINHFIFEKKHFVQHSLKKSAIKGVEAQVKTCTYENQKNYMCVCDGGVAAQLAKSHR